jgi:hypothetical protein
MQRRNLVVPVTGDLSAPRALSHRRYVRVNNAQCRRCTSRTLRLSDSRWTVCVVCLERTRPARDTNAVIIRSLFGGGGRGGTAEYATQLLQRMDRL